MKRARNYLWHESSRVKRQQLQSRQQRTAQHFFSNSSGRSRFLGAESASALSLASNFSELKWAEKCCSIFAINNKSEKLLFLFCFPSCIVALICVESTLKASSLQHISTLSLWRILIRVENEISRGAIIFSLLKGSAASARV